MKNDTVPRRASTLKKTVGYSAVIRDAKNNVIAECLHIHVNRDNDEYLDPRLRHSDYPLMQSAFSCAKTLLTAMLH